MAQREDDLRKRAGQCRAIAAKTEDEDARRLLLEIAAEFEAAADHLRLSVAPPHHEVFGGRR